MQQKARNHKYPEFKKSNFPVFESEIKSFWESQDIFKKSVANRSEKKDFVFYEGPPSANGLPGIHHVMARTIKDLFCRYKTLKGFKVERKAGWDTHGLPIELQVEKSLGITKEDIGKKISIEEYNAACRKDVMKYKSVWDDLTEKIGYWVDLEHPYITYENDYIETVWQLLKQLHKKGLLYKGYTIQPYSPAAGTGLSSHELNQPGTYKMLKDTTVIAQFKIDAGSDTVLFESTKGEPVYALAWTTTPWTLPSNTALAVGKKIEYALVKTYNQYTFKPIIVLLAKDLLGKYFKPENAEMNFSDYQEGQKEIPWELLSLFKGGDLIGLRYEQLMPYTLPVDEPGDAFQVIAGDFVSTEEGTGIVHIAPTFGADDARVAKLAGVPPMLILNDEGKKVPLVDLQGRFVEVMGEFAGKYVKNEYYTEAPERSVDVEIAIKLKEENKAFRVEKYEHSYPHCWRTDKPVLYYPLESWFIKTTAVKDRLIALNKTIHWKPEHTGEGRFGNWLENLVDWNLSRSRYWGTPLPVWRTEDGLEEKCIGSIAELKEEIAKSVEMGLMPSEILEKAEDIELHRPYVDHIVLVSDTNKPMRRETDLIDVWFDSGAMPYAQWGLNKSSKLEMDFNPGFKNAFPADFIAEGVDQTRGWFFTLHAISTMLFDQVSYRNVVANGLVLDKMGNKMSKRLGNTVDPFETIATYGADATRWYLIGNAAPWENLKFDIEGLAETQRKFFGTLYNTYSFFALYANLDGFVKQDFELSEDLQYSELDRWVLSALYQLIEDVQSALDAYEPHVASRSIQDFVNDQLSNWYVRLARRRFWKSEASEDKKAAFETLFHCLLTVSQLMSPIAPFISDWLYRNLTLASTGTGTENNLPDSVHLTDWVSSDNYQIDTELLERMEIAQKLSSMVLAIRKKEKIKVRQPLQTILIPASTKKFEQQVNKVKELILSEVNVKELRFLDERENTIIVKSAKADFKKLGPKVGPDMKQLSGIIAAFSSEQIQTLEQNGSIDIKLGEKTFNLTSDEIEIMTKDVEGWQVEVNGNLTVALDLNIDENLRSEGIAREMVNRIQNMRKESGFEVNDRIIVKYKPHVDIEKSLNSFRTYICNEVLANEIRSDETLKGNAIELNDISTILSINKVN
ncbi:MAG: isoleucine--tRNA ligase [Flavobacteriales bacterium]|nr:isoleucine--tRNA ligase [Flavobacteriales bacterium]